MIMIKNYYLCLFLFVIGISDVSGQSVSKTLAGFPATYDFPANAVLSIANAQPSYLAATLRVAANGDVSNASFQIADSIHVKYTYGLFELNIKSINYNSNEDVLVCSGFIEMPTIFQEDSVDVHLNFSGLKLNSTGILDLGDIHTNIPIHYNGFYYGLGTYSHIYKDSLVLDGYMVLPHNIAQLHSNLKLGANNSVQIELDSIKGEFLHAFGYDFEVLNGSFSNGSWSIGTNLILPDGIGVIPAGEMKVDTTGITQIPSFLLSDTLSLNLGIYKAKPTKAWLSDNAFYVNADLDLLGENIHFDSLIISNSGNLVGRNVSTASNMNLSGFQLDSTSLIFGKFLIDSLANQKYGFELGGKVNLPNNWGAVKITDARIYLDGTFYGGRLNGNHKVNLNGLEFKPDKGQFFPSLSFYTLTGGVQSHADTSVVQIFIDDDLEGYSPMINGKWTYTGVRFPNLQASDVKVINIIDTDGDGEYNTLKDAIFDISDSISFSTNNGALGHYKGSSNLPNGSLIEIELNDQVVGRTIVWDHHWEYYGFGLADPSSGKLSVVGSKASDGYLFSSASLSNQKLVNIEYRGKSIAKVSVGADNTFKSPVFELLNYDPTELKVIAYQDSDKDGVIDLNKDQSTNITNSISTQNISGTIYSIFGKSSENNGSVVEVSMSSNSIGKATVWDGKWQISYTQGAVTKSALTAKVYSSISLDSLLEDVSAYMKSQKVILDEVDFSEWTEYHSFNVDADPQKNASVLMEGELDFPGLGNIAIDDLDVSSTALRSPGKKDSHGSPHFRFDGYSFNLNSFDLDITKPQIELDGEILLPDNAGSMWAKLEGDLNGIQFKSLEAEQKQMNFGRFDFHIDNLTLNSQNEMVLKGELDVPNFDKYLTVDQLVIAAKSGKKTADIATENLNLKLNNYAFNVTQAQFVSDTLASGAATDTLKMDGTFELGGLGNLTAQSVHINYQGKIMSGKYSIGPKGLKAGGFDLSQNIDSIQFVNNELHISEIPYTISGSSSKITFKHILIDNQLNFKVDEVLLSQANFIHNGYTFTPDQIKWVNDTIKMNGLLSLGSDLGNVEIDGVSLLADGSLVGGVFKPAVNQLSYHGFKLDASSIVWNKQQLISMDGAVELPDSLGNITLSGLKVSPTKVEDYGSISFVSPNIQWKNFSANMDSIGFVEPYFVMNGTVTIPQLGSVKLKELKLDANGNFEGGTIVLPDSAKIQYNGFTLIPSQLTIETNAIEIDGEIKLSGNRGLVAVSGLEINGDGTFSEGHFLYTEGSSPLEFNGLHLEVNSVDIKNAQLQIYAAMELPNNAGRIGAKLLWSTGQEVSLDSIFVRNTNINYSGFTIDLTNCDYVNNNFVFDGNMMVDNVGSFKVSQLKLSAQGAFNGGSVSFQGTSWQWGSLSAQINSASIIDHEILLEADLSLPNNMGTLGLKGVKVDLNGTIIQANITANNLSYGGYVLNLDSASLTNNELITINGNLDLPKNYGKINIQGFTVKNNGEIVGGVGTYAGNGINIGQLKFLIDQIQLDSNSISIDGSMQLPDSIGGKVDIQGLSFNQTGDVNIGSILPNDISIQVQGFTCHVSALSWNNQAQRISLDGSLQLPKNLGLVNLTALEMGTDGSFYEGNFDLSGLNLEYNGIQFSPSALSINGSSLSFDGNLTLPGGASVGFVGMKMSESGIDDFGQINAQGVQFKWKGYDFELAEVNFQNNLFSFSGKVDLGKYGSLKAEDIQISTNGTFYGGTIKPSDAQLKFASMALTLDSLSIQQQELEFTGSLDLPNNQGKIRFSDIDITTSGGFTGGKVTYEGNGFSFKNGEYSVVPSDIVLGDNSFTLDARVIETATDSVKAIMTGTTITGSPFDIQFGTETLLDTDIYYKGFDIKVDTFTVSGSDLIYTGSITIPQLGKLAVDHLVLNASSGNITDHGNITYTGQTWNLGQTAFTIDSVKLEEDFIEVKAKMQLPNNAGEVDVNSMKFTTSGTLLSAEVDVQGINMGYGNYTVGLTHAAIEGNELELDGTINLNDFGTFNVQDLEFNMSTGAFKTAMVTSQNTNFSIGSFTAVPQEIILSNSSLSATGYLQLPAIFGDSAHVSFSGFKISSDGSFSIDSIKAANVDVKYKGIDLAFTDLEWNDGLIISADLTLPGNSNRVQLQNLKVDQSGNVSGGIISANGVTMDYHGYTLTLNDAEFQSGSGVKLSGSFGLPGGTASLSVTDLVIDESGISDYGTVALSSTTPVKWHDYEVQVSNVAMQDGTVLLDGSIGLSGVATLSVSQMGVSSSGSFIPGNITLENQQSISMGQNSLTLSEISFSGSDISFSGEVDFGSNRKMLVKDMTVDFQGGFDGGTVTYSGDPITFNGSSITPYNMGYENGVFNASASMALPNNLATVTVTDLGIDHNFNITVGEVEVSGVSIHYKGIIINLDSAIYQGNDLEFWGSLENDKLGTLQITGLTMNTQGVITGGKVDYSGTQKFGQLTVTIDDLGFDWGQGDISITGSLALPSDMGKLTVDTLMIDPHNGTIKSGTLSSTIPITYGGVGITQISATINDNEVELDGTAQLPDQFGLISVNGLDISLDNASISGGTFTYQEQQPITFGGAGVSITSLSFNLEAIDLSAQVELPSNLGKAGVNDASFKDGKFALASVSFSGQTVSIKGVSCTITKGLITDSDVLVSIDVSLSDAAQFGIDDFNYNYSSSTFSGGTFNLEKAEFKYKDFDLEILNSNDQGGKSKFSAQFAIPGSSGHAKIENIYISLEDGLDFSSMTMDYGSLPNLLPTGFSLTITQHEALNNGILLSGHMDLLGSSVDVKGLKITTDGVDIAGVEIKTPSYKMGGFQMPNLDFAFAKDGNNWEIDISGDADIPDVGGLEFSGYIKSDGDFGGQFVLTGAFIELGESGFALYNPGGGIYDSSGVISVKLFGDVAPIEMQYVYVIHGTLIVSTDGTLSGEMVGKLFNMVELQKSTAAINVAKGTIAYNTGFSFGIKTPPKTGVIKKVDAITQQIPTVEILGYGGGFHASTFGGFEISGSGNAVLVNVQVGTIDLDVDDKHFQFTAEFDIPSPAGGTPLVSCVGDVSIDFDAGSGELYGSAAVLGHQLASMDFKFGPDTISATADIDLVVGQFDVAFQTSKHSDGNHHLDYFHGDAYIGFLGMTFAEMKVDVTESAWSGSAHAWIPGFGSEIDISINGTPKEVVYFDGYEALRVFNIQLEEAEFKYQKVGSKKYISLSSHASLPHFGRASFDVEMEQSGSQWGLSHLDGEVDAFIDINLPVFGHWHKDLGKATIDYDRSKGKLDIDLHTTLLNAGIVRVTDLYAHVYFHEPSATIGVKGHYGLGKHTYNLKKLSCSYHWCCHLHCHWENCCYWTVDLGNKSFDLSVKVKGPSLPSPPKEKAIPPAPAPIVIDCSVEHIQAASVCNNMNYDSKTFSKKFLIANEFHQGRMHNSKMEGCDLTNGLLDAVDLYQMTFEDTKMRSTTLDKINSANYVYFKGNTNLNKSTFKSSTFNHLTVQDLTISEWNINEVSFQNSTLKNLSLKDQNWNKLTMTSSNLNHLLMASSSLSNCDFSKNKFLQVTLNEGGSVTSTNFENVEFTGCHLDSISIDLTTKFNGASFNSTVLEKLDLTGNTELKNISISNNSALIHVVLENANISGGSWTGLNLGNLNMKGVEASKMDLTTVTLVGAQLTGANFFSSNFNSVDLHNSNLEGVNFSSVMFTGSNLNHSTVNNGTNFNGATFANTDLQGVDLTNNPNLKNIVVYGTSDLHAVSFDGSNLSGAKFYSVTFHKTNFKDANLRGAEFHDCTFDTTDFQSATLSQAKFYNPIFKGFTDFHGATLDSVDLSNLGTNFNNTNLSGVDFSYANLRGVDFSGSTIDFANFAHADLTNANLGGCFGRPLTMLKYDGKDDYLHVPLYKPVLLDYYPKSKPRHSGNFDGNRKIEVMLNEPETEITHEMWFKTTHSSGGLFSIEAFEKGVNKGHDRHIYIKNGDIYTRVWESTGSEIIHSSGINYADGKWHHLAHVIGKTIGGQKLYVDGKLAASGTKHLSGFDWQDRALIAYSEDASPKYFVGQIDEVRIWRHTLSESTINDWKAQPVSYDHPHFSKLVVYYPFDEGNGDWVTNKAFPGMISNWQARSKAENTNSLTSTHFDFGPSLQMEHELTLETWAISSSSVWNDYGNLISKRDGFILHPNQNKTSINLHFKTTASSSWQVIGVNSAPNPGVWRHYAATFGKGKAKFYVDGNLLVTKNIKSNERLIVQEKPIYIGRDNVTFRKTLKGNMSRINIWGKAMSDSEIKKRASLQSHASIVSPMHPDYKYLRLSLKRLDWDKRNYSFNGRFSNGMKAASGKWSSENAPLYLPHTLPPNALNGAEPTTIEMNLMAEANNGKAQVLFQHKRAYDSGNEIKAFYGFDIRRDADRKLSFHLYRKVYQKTMVYEKYTYPVINVEDSAVWNYVVDDGVEQNIAFRIQAWPQYFKIELLINGETKGVKFLDAKEFNDVANTYFFRQNENPFASSAQHLIASGSKIDVKNPDSNAEFKDLLKRDHFYNGYLFDVRIWNTILSTKTLKEWRLKDVTPAHPNFNHLKLNLPMNDGSSDVLNHGYAQRNEVRYGQWVRLKHRNTNFELATRNKKYTYNNNGGGNMIMATPNTGYKNWWQVLPVTGTDFNSVKGQFVKKGDAFILKNAKTGEYLGLHRKHHAYKSKHLKELGSVKQTALNADVYWVADSITVYENNQVSSSNILKSGSRFFLKYGTTNNYLYSDTKVGVTKGHKDLYGNQKAATSTKVSENNFWVIEEVQEVMNFDQMFSKTQKMPTYITLPNFDSATLKNTTMPDGTVK